MNVLQNIPYCVEAIVDTHEHIHNLCIAIPEGRKGMVWFTQNKCYILTLSKDRKSFDNVSIDTSIIYYPNRETLLYGTFYFIDNYEQFYFTIEDIFTYNNVNVSSYPIDVKINIWKYMLDYEIPRFDKETSMFIIGIPFMASSWEEMCKILPHISYNIQSVRFHFEDEAMIEKMVTTVSRIHYYYLLSSNRKQQLTSAEQIQQTNNFLVQADNTNDIYYLYTISTQEYVGIAGVQTLATSTYLNTIFRNVKEDMNIDALEESDDEDNYNMVTDTTKKVVMECVYNTKFKKWTPVKLIQ